MTLLSGWWRKARLVPPRLTREPGEQSGVAGAAQGGLTPPLPPNARAAAAFPPGVASLPRRPVYSRVFRVCQFVALISM